MKNWYMLCTASFACGRYTYAYTCYDKQDTMQSIEIEGFIPFYEPAITRNKNMCENHSYNLR